MTPAERTALKIATDFSWERFNVGFDAIKDEYADVIALESDEVLEALAGHDVVGLEAVVEMAKDIIESRHCAATVANDYFDAKYEGALARRG